VKKVKLLKTVSYRLLSSAIGFFVVYLATGSAKGAGIVSTAELLYKPLQYFLHELLWMKYEAKKQKQNDTARPEVNLHPHS